jgi:hypothetical protein
MARRIRKGWWLISKVWQLRLSLHFLADEGNLLDAAALAAMGALRHFRKPEVEVLGDEVIVVRLASQKWSDLARLLITSIGQKKGRRSFWPYIIHHYVSHSHITQSEQISRLV